MEVKRRFYLMLVLFSLLFFFAYTPIQASAGLVWSEQFDELNEEYWDFVASQIIDGALRPVQGPNNTKLDRAAMRAYRHSNVTTGTWEFDLNETKEWGEELDILKIYFISPGRPDFSDYYAVNLAHSPTESGECYSYTIEKWFDSKKTLLATYLGQSMSSTKGVLQHMAITRQSSGLISVYLNSSLIMQATDTDITNTTYFGFYTWDDWAFDNLYVYDTIEVGGDMTPIVIGAVAAVPIAIIAIILIRRRY